MRWTSWCAHCPAVASGLAMFLLCWSTSALPQVSATPAVTSASTAAPTAAALGLMAYPAKGQSASKQARDEQECYAWAKQQTGHDPLAPEPVVAKTSPASTASTTARDGSRARGAVRGAATGAVIGEVTNDDAGKGAAVGATVGIVSAGRQQRIAEANRQQQVQAEQKTQAEQAKAAREQADAQFRRGLSVCLEARGYAVK